MLEVKNGSWLLNVPAFSMGTLPCRSLQLSSHNLSAPRAHRRSNFPSPTGFYALNMWMLATGLMDPMIPMLFGTDDSLIPIMTGPVGKSLWLSNAFALTALCYLFLPSTGLPPKITFQAFFIIQLPWSAARAVAQTALCAPASRYLATD